MEIQMKGMFKRQVTCLETQNFQTTYEKGALHFRIFAYVKKTQQHKELING
jgi:hypothetical protein